MKQPFDLEVGDVVFFRPSSIWADLIALTTKSDYSHVGLAVGEREIIEADRFIKTRKRVLKEEEPIAVFRLPNLDANDRYLINAYANRYKGLPYDWSLIAGHLIDMAFGREWDFFNRANALICSEYIDQVFTDAGMMRLNDASRGYLRPQELLHAYPLRKVYDSV